MLIMLLVIYERLLFKEWDVLALGDQFFDICVQEAFEFINATLKGFQGLLLELYSSLPVAIDHPFELQTIKCPNK